MRMNPKVDQFLSKARAWQEEMEQLRLICLESRLTEALKWGKPCYAFEGNNIAIIQPFKDTCALLFFKGALLKDPEGVLEKPGKHSQAGRRIPFTGVRQIVELEPVLKAYIQEAVEAEKAGLKVELDEKKDLEYPEELREKLEESPELETAFESLTPGRQRAYILYFSGAKQAKTRARRIEKYRDKILDGKGMRD